MRTNTTSIQTTRKRASIVMNCDGCCLAWTCTSREFVIGNSNGAKIVLTPNIAVMVCGYRSPFFARCSATRYQINIEAAPIINCSGQVPPVMASEATTIAEIAR